jgi:hypothetical protein
MTVAQASFPLPLLTPILNFQTTDPAGFSYTCIQIFHSGLGEPINQPCVPALKHFDPDIGVEQVAHHQIFAEGSGSSGGRSNSLSAQHPMISAKSGRRSFISSNVGSSFSSSTSEIARRTRDSNTRAFSGASRSKLRSSSNAIVATNHFCHGPTRISTFHFPTP